jgi:hypothetical protein
MNISFSPEFQMEVYLDKQESYVMQMLDRVTSKSNKEVEKSEDSSSSNNDNNNNKNKQEPFFKESDYGSFKAKQSQNLNSSIGSTASFFNTLANAGGSVKNSA